MSLNILISLNSLEGNISVPAPVRLVWNPDKPSLTSLSSADMCFCLDNGAGFPPRCTPLISCSRSRPTRPALQEEAGDKRELTEKKRGFIQVKVDGDHLELLRQTRPASLLKFKFSRRGSFSGFSLFLLFEQTREGWGDTMSCSWTAD